MAEAGVRRIVAVSAATVTVAGDGPGTRFLVKPLLRRVLRHPRADSIAMERHLESTDLDWTVLRPPMLTNGPRTGRYRTARGENVRGGLSVSRADLADAALRVLTEDYGHHDAVGVAR
ncbi:NAD(P)-dependent oxidoreductase [Haloactinospora alba]|uniref:NAD(P)-dependent oxidoreductase n=1 Tax=Haloactinospora alba TaxID=405555 RepID=UPI001B866FE5|nr:NAD(P)-binding oxidoreductase [Haloactinospora alba]